MYSAIAMMYAVLIDCCCRRAQLRRLADPIVHRGEEVVGAALRQTHQTEEDHRRVLPRELEVQVTPTARDEALDELDAPRPDHRLERLDDLGREQRREQLAVLGVLRRVELLGDHPAHRVGFGGVDQLRALVHVQDGAAREELGIAQRRVHVVVPHQRPHVPVGGGLGRHEGTGLLAQPIPRGPRVGDEVGIVGVGPRSPVDDHPDVVRFAGPHPAILAHRAKVVQRAGCGSERSDGLGGVQVPEEVERLVEPVR